jgi:ATP-dependent Clp protease adaptor protein ClpS
MGDMSSNDLGRKGGILEKKKEIVKEPDMYTVILHNDHFTTMDFVVEVIMKIFHKPVAEATKIMLDVHKKGRGKVGLYPFDIAATKVAQVKEMAKQAEFPLRCTMEPA